MPSDTETGWMCVCVCVYLRERERERGQGKKNEKWVVQRGDCGKSALPAVCYFGASQAWQSSA